MKSTIKLLSNIQILDSNSKGMPLHDKNFLSKITAPEAIKVLEAKRRNKETDYYLNDLQNEIFYKVERCNFAIEGDYPWGVDVTTGKAKCYCVKTSCKYFKDCRPDFDVQELIEYQKRKTYWKSKCSMN